MNAWRLKIRDWMRGFGATETIIFALVVVLVVGFFYFTAPAANEHIADPVAESLGVQTGRCPSGWKDTSEEDEHTLIKSCQRDGWLVVLDERGRFQHAFQLDTPGSDFVFNPAEVPGWPR